MIRDVKEARYFVERCPGEDKCNIWQAAGGDRIGKCLATCAICPLFASKEIDIVIYRKIFDENRD